MKLDETITIGLDIADYFTQTRVYECRAMSCKYMDQKTCKCAVKCVVLDFSGKCMHYEKVR